MKQGVERNYQASLQSNQKLPTGITAEKVTQAMGTIPFRVGKLEVGRVKSVLLWRPI